MLRFLTAAMALVTMAVAAPSHAQDRGPELIIDRTRIDLALQDMVRSGRTVGASVLIWKDGGEAYFATEGLADREEYKPFQRDTLIQIFSMTKPVTGVALMTLWEQGKFRLDDPLAMYMPQFAEMYVLKGTDEAGKPILEPASRHITIRDIMRHTAGFTYGGEENFADMVWLMLDPLSPENDLATFARLLADVPLLYEPGREWRYSAAVDVQARLVEVLSGHPFEEYVRANVFLPLGMADSGWTRDPAEIDRLAMIYRESDYGMLVRETDEGRLTTNYTGKPMTMGGSGIITTIDDYMRFARMLLNNGELDGLRVLQPSTVRLMATDHLDPAITERQWLGSKGTGGFGFDFFVRTAPPQTPEENRGAVGEFFWDGYASTLFWVDPINDMAVVFAAQKIPIDLELHRAIREAIYGKNYVGSGSD